MSSQPVCPCCRSPQATQRVAAIVSSGTQQVRVLSADLVPAAGVARTDLGQMQAPPCQPGGGWLIVVLHGYCGHYFGHERPYAGWSGLGCGWVLR